jgi:aminoglycoside phosphotransferase (APT) family kinase protein
VIDWEDAGYAPPATDLLYGALTAHATFGSPLPAAVPGEAADWVEGILTERMRRDGIEQGDTDDPQAALLAVLRGLPRIGA